MALAGAAEPLGHALSGHFVPFVGQVYPARQGEQVAATAREYVRVGQILQRADPSGAA
jgi:hypothetical protein